MAVSINDHTMYQLADMLGMELTVQSASGLIFGSVSYDFRVGNLKKTVDMTVVDSILTKKFYAAQVNVMGNLAVIVSAPTLTSKDASWTCCLVINRAKWKGANGILSDLRPQTLGELLKGAASAVKMIFKQDEKAGKWVRVEPRKQAA